MTARSRLIELAECFYDEWAGRGPTIDHARSEIEHIAGIADAILDEHAHELAEDLRVWYYDTPIPDLSALDAADRIDPEMNK